jgi:hypothetical protein
MNGITYIDPIETSEITNQDLIFALLVDICGVHISSIPNSIEGNISYTNDWEYFDPKEVESPELLPDHWAKVYEMHNRPEMHDCILLDYKYIHSPTEILPRYPRVSCKGIFCISSNKSLTEITGDDLIHIGNEIDND